MNIEEIRDYCLAKKGVTEGFPFDEVTLVFKVMNKMYALVGLERTPPFINLKCDPERAIELREQYEDIQPGYHMHKVIMELYYTVTKVNANSRDYLV
jgi:predicted DNA-binding protein (MmcQ/YjbR family)